MSENMYVVVKITKDQWSQMLYKDRPIRITEVEAILSVDELRSLAMWDALKEISGR